MFCPYCGKQNDENTLFCKYCGKSLAKTEPLPQENQVYQKPKKTGLSYNAKRGIVTAVLIAGFVLVILLIYYPSLFPWNW